MVWFDFVASHFGKSIFKKSIGFVYFPNRITEMTESV
jgi:hypothetical protein